MTAPIPFLSQLPSTVGRFLQGPWAGRAALAAWLIYGLVLGIVVAVDPDRRTVTPNYRQAAEKWWPAQEDIYTGKKKGFLYLPQSAILYTPIAALPKRVGEPLWRWIGLGVLAWGLWRAGRTFGPSSLPPTGRFALLTALTIPASLASAGNGQMNILLGALFLHTAVELAEKSWLRSSATLVLAFALKPLAAVYLLLTGALLPKVRWWLAGALLLLFLLPFLHPAPDYVLRQFQLAAQVLRSSSQPDFHDFCDLAGMFRTFGLPLPDALWFAIRALAAFITLGLGWLALRRRPWPEAQLLIYTLAVTYLVLFNPRTEANTYILLAPAIALFALRALPATKPDRFSLGFKLLALLALALGVDSYGFLHQWTNLWLKALLTSIFAGWLAREILLNGALAGPAKTTTPTPPEAASHQSE